MTIYLLGLTAVIGIAYAVYLRTSNRSTKKGYAFDNRNLWASERATFLNFGMVFALGFVSLAFEYQTFNFSEVNELSDLQIEELIELDEVPVTQYQEPEPLPPPPAPEQPKTSMFIPSAEIVLADPEEVIEQPAFEIPTTTAEQKMVALPPTPPSPPPPAPKVTAPEAPMIFAEQMPRFDGCEGHKEWKDEELAACASQKLLTFLGSNTKYPALARANGIEGTAVVQFVVEKDGSISDAKVVRDPGGGLGREALRVVESMPTWIPGKQRGRPVRVQFNVPVKFILQN